MSRADSLLFAAPVARSEAEAVGPVALRGIRPRRISLKTQPYRTLEMIRDPHVRIVPWKQCV